MECCYCVARTGVNVRATASGFVVGFGALPIPYFAAQWMITGALHIRPLLLLSVGGIILGVQFLSLGLLAELMQSRDRSSDLPISETV